MSPIDGAVTLPLREASFFHPSNPNKGPWIFADPASIDTNLVCVSVVIFIEDIEAVFSALLRAVTNTGMDL